MTLASADGVPGPQSNRTVSPGEIPRTAADRCTAILGPAWLTTGSPLTGVPRFHSAAEPDARSSR